MKTKLIINPAAARGQVSRQWPRVAQTLQTEGFAFDHVFTERRGQAVGLARAALDAGFEFIVAVGGDGTLNEVINGMLAAEGQPVNPKAALGVISSGTGSDFARGIDMPREMITAARYLAHHTRTRPIDIGEVICLADGQETRRYFANVAGMGFDAEVVERIESGGKRGGGTVPYLTTLLGTIATYRNKDVAVRIDDRRIRAKVNSVIVCNGRYFGGGMLVSPHATLDDAKLDVIVLGNFGRIEVVLNTHRIYNGTHLTHPKVSEYRCQTVTVEPQQRMLIQADGELVGPGPALFRIHPAALSVLA